MTEKQRFELYKQTNQAAIDFSLKTLNALFLLNGATATAIIASRNETLLEGALLFAVGAFSAVAAMGLSYALIMLLAESWKGPEPPSNEKKCLSVILPWKILYFSIYDVEKFRWAVIGITLFSFGIFSVGVIFCAMRI